MGYRPHRHRLYATISDPVLVGTADGTTFVCWVQELGGGLRWAFVALDRTMYNGPRYNGEDTPEKVRAMVGAWWAEQRATR